MRRMSEEWGGFGGGMRSVSGVMRSMSGVMRRMSGGMRRNIIVFQCFVASVAMGSSVKSSSWT